MLKLHYRPYCSSDEELEQPGPICSALNSLLRFKPCQSSAKCLRRATDYVLSHNPECERLTYRRCRSCGRRRRLQSDCDLAYPCYCGYDEIDCGACGPNRYYNMNTDTDADDEAESPKATAPKNKIPAFDPTAEDGIVWFRSDVVDWDKYGRAVYTDPSGQLWVQANGEYIERLRPRPKRRGCCAPCRPKKCYVHPIDCPRHSLKYRSAYNRLRCRSRSPSPSSFTDENYGMGKKNFGMPDKFQMQCQVEAKTPPGTPNRKYNLNLDVQRSPVPSPDGMTDKFIAKGEIDLPDFDPRNELNHKAINTRDLPAFGMEPIDIDGRDGHAFRIMGNPTVSVYTTPMGTVVYVPHQGDNGDHKVKFDNGPNTQDLELPELPKDDLNKNPKKDSDSSTSKLVYHTARTTFYRDPKQKNPKDSFPPHERAKDEESSLDKERRRFIAELQGHIKKDRDRLSIIAEEYAKGNTGKVDKQPKGSKVENKQKKKITIADKSDDTNIETPEDLDAGTSQPPYIGATPMYLEDDEDEEEGESEEN